MPVIGRFSPVSGSLDRRPLAAERQVELGALPADRIEIDGAGAFGADAVGARQIADALLVVADRDDVDDVVDAVIMEVEAGLAPCAEVARELGLDFPALRRDEVGVAGIFAIAAELGLRQEIVEADLADPAPQLQADVPALGRPPAERDAALGPEEFPRGLIVVGPVELRDFRAARDLQVEIRR